eukprot:gene28546-35425_t
MDKEELLDSQEMVKVKVEDKDKEVLLLKVDKVVSKAVDREDKVADSKEVVVNRAVKVDLDFLLLVEEDFLEEEAKEDSQPPNQPRLQLRRFHLPSQLLSLLQLVAC